MLSRQAVSQTIKMHLHNAIFPSPAIISQVSVLMSLTVCGSPAAESKDASSQSITETRQVELGDNRCSRGDFSSPGGRTVTLWHLLSINFFPWCRIICEPKEWCCSSMPCILIKPFSLPFPGSSRASWWAAGTPNYPPPPPLPPPPPPPPHPPPTDHRCTISPAPAPPWLLTNNQWRRCRWCRWDTACPQETNGEREGQRERGREGDREREWGNLSN